MKLFIVESPNKVKKIREYLGSGWEVIATVGHFRDLPEKELGVDLATLRPSYVIDTEKAGLIGRIKQLARGAAQVVLATDTDREGEAIAWHLAQVLHHPHTVRARFDEITRSAVQKALANVSEIDQHRVDAQQARRVLDRLVGYQISPLLSALGPNQSAGRVQTAALHLVVEREKAREAFRPEAFFTLSATYRQGMVAKYATVDADGEVVPTRVRTKDEAEAIAARAGGPHIVAKVERKSAQRKPLAPFRTSTLQQAASVLLDLSPGATMQLAQSLFEKGLISYHRTDSVTLSEEAVAMARSWIARENPDSLPPTAPTYSNGASAQEAHEAIRPTHIEGADLAGLPGDEAKLFDLIRRRFLASQCKPAEFDQVLVTVTAGDTTWLARAQTIRAHHWLIYLPRDEESAVKADDPEPLLPDLRVGEVLELDRLEVTPGTTKPPPRYSQASLVKELDRLGVGRPSTYASIVDKAEGILFHRDYLAEEKKTVYPTARGRAVDTVLTKAFAELVDAGYTAQMERLLDEIEGGKRRWLDELARWYAPFSAQVTSAAAIIRGELAANPALAAQTPEAPKPTGKPCPLCGGELWLRHGARGAFLACSAHPRCSYSADPSAVRSTRPCPKCGKALEELDGRYGHYARCLDPACRATVDLALAVEDKCPRCQAALKDKGDFLGCSNYPTCRFTIDKTALAKAKTAAKYCPQCKRMLVPRKGAKGAFWACPGYPECKHTEAAEPAKKARKAVAR